MLSILPAPKAILQKIRSIQRSFLWSGSAEKRKWALAAWDKVCKPKLAGCLNLIDPDISKKTGGAKLWWRWLKETNLPWAIHWKEKYTPNCRDQDLIRLQELLEGSPIWNLEKKNKNLIQEHSFWEIRNGESALLWEDSWQQHPKLEIPELEAYKINCQNRGKHSVHQYWNPDSQDQEWRESSLPDAEIPNEEYNNLQNLLLILNKRKIRITTEEDKLRWGLTGNGNFTLKEARRQMEFSEQGEDASWFNKVWDPLFWPKIQTFLWLLMRRNTLTWENLQKRALKALLFALCVTKLQKL